MAENNLLCIWGGADSWVYHADYQGSASAYAKLKYVHRPRHVQLAIHPAAMQLAYVDAAPTLNLREWRRHRQQQLRLGIKPLQPGQYCFSLPAAQLANGLQRHWLLACDAYQLQKLWVWWYQRFCVQPIIAIPAWQLLSTLRSQDLSEPFDGCILWQESDVWVWLIYLGSQLVTYESSKQPHVLLQSIQAQPRAVMPDLLWVVGLQNQALTDFLHKLAWSGEQVNFLDDQMIPNSRYLISAARGE